MPYQPRQYWERRLGDQFSPRGVGHIGFSDAYNTWLYRRKRRCIEACLGATSLENKKVLDIGCGTGFFVDWYLEQGATVCGLDITGVSVERLKHKHPQCEFYMQDIGDPDYPFGGRNFDIVNMWDVGYHIVDDERLQQAFDNIARSVRSNALLLFTDWFGAPADLKMAEHVKMRCLETHEKHLSQKGFELVGIRPLYNYLNKVHFRGMDNRLGWLYAFLDDRSESIPVDNISLGVWRYR